MKIKLTIAALLGLTVIIGYEGALRAQGSRTTRDGIFTKEQAVRGQALYAQHCAACHGQSLEGIEMAPALSGGDFLDKWIGQTVGDLFERIRTTMPQTKPGRLARDVNVDITAYIISVNEFPAGAADLPRDTQILKQIRIEPPKTDNN
jgi:mono/diheme cytochrome c family protein